MDDSLEFLVVLLSYYYVGHFASTVTYFILFVLVTLAPTLARPYTDQLSKSVSTSKMTVFLSGFMKSSTKQSRRG